MLPLPTVDDSLCIYQLIKVFTRSGQQPAATDCPRGVCGEQSVSTKAITCGDISPILLENLQNKQKWHSSIQISKCI